MSRSEQDGLGKAFWFCLTWAAVHNQVKLSVEHSFLGAALLYGVAWLTFKFTSKAVFRLGWRGWSLLAQFIGCLALFLYAAPTLAVIKMLIVWGIGLPLYLAGAGWRVLCLRLALGQAVTRKIAQGAALAALAAIPPLSWWFGYGFWFGIPASIVTGMLAAIPLYYGWRLAAPPPRGDRDAQFGTSDDFNAAGMSHEL